MIVYSFFLKYEKGDEYEFMIDYAHCLKEKYTGFHPIIKDTDGSSQILYAMTTSKRLKELFIITRNMKIFNIYKSDVSNKKYKEMKKTFPEMILTEYELIDGNHSLKRIPMVMTNYEKQHVNDDSFIVQKFTDIYCNNQNTSLIDQFVLNTNLEKTLNRFGFSASIDLLSFGGANDSDIEYYASEYYGVLNKFLNVAKIKTFEVFIELFGNTLKG